MLKLIRRIGVVVLLLASPAFSAAATGAELSEVQLAVEGMNCKFCPITIRKALEKVDGVESAKVDLDTARATVLFDASKVSVEILEKSVTEAGYPARRMSDQ